MQRKQNYILTIGICTLIVGFMLAGIVLPDKARSESERRSLAKLPELSTESVMNGSWFDDMEEYLADHFPAREWFRKIKAAGNYYLLGRMESNEYYVVDGSVSKLDYPLNEKSVEHAADMYEKVAGLFENGTCYFTIIPDKNYYLAAQQGYPVMDYVKMEAILSQGLENMKYISIFDCFNGTDYYKTDLHLKQEAYLEAADTLLEKMENPYRTGDTEFKYKEIDSFYGAWHGQAALSLDADTIGYLDSPAIQNAVVYDYETGTESTVYSEEALLGPDKYDFFLSGARALLTVSNPDAKTDRELVLVRDSFGSSMAPLLLEGYSKITLVDLRYIASDMLGQFVDTTKPCDVLFALNTGIINNSNMLK